MDVSSANPEASSELSDLLGVKTYANAIGVGLVLPGFNGIDMDTKELTKPFQADMEYFSESKECRGPIG